MYIGLSGYSHESSAALVDNDGALIDYCREEYLTRIKGDKSFPKKSLRKILIDNSLNIEEIKKIAFYERPLSAFLHPLKVAASEMPKSLPLLSHQFRNFKNSSIACYLDLSKNFSGLEKKLIYVDHHLSHTLTALPYSSDQKNICSVVVDGFGDRSTASISYLADCFTITELWSAKYPNSLGLFYSAITDFLGFAINEGEYKVMGLAAFGSKDTKYKDILKSLIKWDDKKNSFITNLDFFNYHTSPTESYDKKLIKLLGNPRNPFKKLKTSDANFQNYADIARAAQEITVEILCDIFKHAHKLTSCNKFFFSGGVASNSASLNTIANLPFVDEIIIPPSPGDAGAAIGAAYYAFLKSSPNCGTIPRPNLFPSRFDFKKQLKISKKIISNDFDLITTEKESILEKCSELLKSGEIIGTIINNAETGPRSLGNRSLICNGRDKSAVQNLNTVIKNRSPFRPTAPAMTFKTASKYYDLNLALMESYKSMGATCKCLENSISKGFPVTHIDGTTRLQIVEENSFIYKLLQNLENYDIDILANSSLNISGDPTCYDLIDGLMVCSKTPLRFLVTDLGLLQKKI